MALTTQQRIALRLLGDTHPDMDAIVTSDRTFWDGEVGAACVHWRTAHSLRHLGFVWFEVVPGGDYDPWAIRLTDEGRAAVEQIRTEML